MLCYKVGATTGASAHAQTCRPLHAGVHEACELRDGGPGWLGKGVTKAVANVNDIIAPALKVRVFCPTFCPMPCHSVQPLCRASAWLTRLLWTTSSRRCGPCS